jgi:hypothetical protein
LRRRTGAFGLDLLLVMSLNAVRVHEQRHDVAVGRRYADKCRLQFELDAAGGLQTERGVVCGRRATARAQHHEHT